MIETKVFKTILFIPKINIFTYINNVKGFIFYVFD